MNTYREPDPPKPYRPRLRLHDLLREQQPRDVVKEHSGAKLGGPALSSHQREKNLKPSISRAMAKPQGRAFQRVAPNHRVAHFRASCQITGWRISQGRAKSQGRAFQRVAPNHRVAHFRGSRQITGSRISEGRAKSQGRHFTGSRKITGSADHRMKLSNHSMSQNCRENVRIWFGSILWFGFGNYSR